MNDMKELRGFQKGGCQAERSTMYKGAAVQMSWVKKEQSSPPHNHGKRSVGVCEAREACSKAQLGCAPRDWGARGGC